MTISAAKLNKTEVIKVYTQTAPIYDIWGRLTETRARQRALAFANIHNGESILEVAVGTGLTFLEILKANPEGDNIGIDLTPAMLAKAQAEHPGIPLTIGDAICANYFPGPGFDLPIFCLLPCKGFIHVLAEFQRVLKPGGRLVLVNMAKPSAGSTIFGKPSTAPNPACWAVAGVFSSLSHSNNKVLNKLNVNTSAVRFSL